MWGTTKGEFRGDHITTADAGGSPRFATTHPQPSPPTFAALPDSPSILGSRQTDIERIPLPWYERKLPIVLSPQEVKALLEAPRNLGHRTMLSTMYAAGPRVSELAHLNVRDIDSARNAIWIRGGKGRQDRQTLLPPKLLELLRSYWRWKRPKDWLFPGNKPGQPICRPSIFRA